MTTTEIGNQLVDLAILSTVHDAASLRLARVREQEKAATGVAKTDLTDVARSALARWNVRPDGKVQSGRRPSIVRVTDAEDGSYVATCLICPERFPGETRQEARHASKGHAATHSRPFRFSMDRDTYRLIKSRIQAAGRSVASVVEDGLETFARTGQL